MRESERKSELERERERERERESASERERESTSTKLALIAVIKFNYRLSRKAAATSPAFSTVNPCNTAATTTAAAAAFYAMKHYFLSVNQCFYLQESKENTQIKVSGIESCSSEFCCPI